ncbi:MAG: Gfo/Idh/MocA family oxidoreductase [Kiritimatiellae bacterium]|nr:Gfo/Idh/MocA family oxidoreductase [Kiritimatiellia bacterium]
MNGISRKSFLKGVVAAGSAPFLFNGCSTGFFACRKINVGVIGYGRIAHTMDVPGVQQFADRCVVTAVCDYDAVRAAYGKKVIEERYAQRGVAQTVKTHADYHEMLADPSIDAVLICIPDHQHALVATDCLLAGKHVYLQKPFAQTIQEGRAVANLATMKGLVVQVGAWQRSRPQFRKVVQLVRNGRLGRIARVEVGIGCDRSGGCRTPEPVPATFNYDAWLGPTPEAPYNWTRCHVRDLKRIGDRPGWIQLAPYGWGMITNWGAHHLDVTAWGLNRDPDSVSGTCEWMDLSGTNLWNVHTTYDLHYDCGGTDVHVNDKFQMGVKFVGENGDWLWCTRGAMKVTPSDPEPVVAPGMLGPIAASRKELLADLRPGEIVDDALAHGGEKFLAIADHFENWLEAVAREDPQYTVSTAVEAHKSTAFCSLGRMCMELGRGKKDGATLAWNAATETSGNPEADKMLVPFARGKYDLRRSFAGTEYDYCKMIRPAV